MNVSGLYIVKGDSTCDGRLTLEDLILTQLHMVGAVTLTGDAFTGADSNSDNEIDVVDLANINKHLSGRKMITGVVAK